VIVHAEREDVVAFGRHRALRDASVLDDASLHGATMDDSGLAL
jgi:hypothetical protein